MSMTARLVLRSNSADFLLTILIAAYCPVETCLAFLTRPEAPLPIVFPSCHGPTWVFRLDFPEALVDVLEAWESRLEWPGVRVLSPDIAEMRLSSALEVGEPGSFRVWRMPPGASDP